MDNALGSLIGIPLEFTLELWVVFAVAIGIVAIVRTIGWKKK